MVSYSAVWDLERDGPVPEQTITFGGDRSFESFYQRQMPRVAAFLVISEEQFALAQDLSYAIRWFDGCEACDRHDRSIGQRANRGIDMIPAAVQDVGKIVPEIVAVHGRSQPSRGKLFCGMDCQFAAIGSLPAARFDALFAKRD